MVHLTWSLGADTAARETLVQYAPGIRNGYHRSRIPDAALSLKLVGLQLAIVRRGVPADTKYAADVDLERATAMARLPR